MTEEEAEKIQIGDVLRMKSSEQLNVENIGVAHLEISTP